MKSVKKDCFILSYIPCPSGRMATHITVEAHAHDFQPLQLQVALNERANVKYTVCAVHNEASLTSLFRH